MESRKLEEERRIKEESRKKEEKWLHEEASKSEQKHKIWAATILQKYIRSLYAKRALIMLIFQERKRREEDKKKRLQNGNGESKVQPEPVYPKDLSREEAARRRLEERRRKVSPNNENSPEAIRAATTIQKYLRSWRAKRIMISLILAKIQQLKTEKLRSCEKIIENKEMISDKVKGQIFNAAAYDQKKNLARRSKALAEMVDSIDTEAAVRAREIIDDKSHKRLPESRYRVYFRDDPLLYIRPYEVSAIPSSRTRPTYHTNIEKDSSIPRHVKSPSSNYIKTEKESEEELNDIDFDGKSSIRGKKPSPGIIKMAINKIPGSLTFRGLKKRPTIPAKLKTNEPQTKPRDDSVHIPNEQLSKQSTNTRSPNPAVQKTSSTRTTRKRSLSAPIAPLTDDNLPSHE